MRLAYRTTLALLSCTLLVGSCVESDSPTGVGDGASVGIGIRPALISSPADADALPINRIRVSVARVSDELLIGQTTVDVNPADTVWSVDVAVPEPYSDATVHVFLRLFHVEVDDTESVQFSGRSDPIDLEPGVAISPEVPIVRGPMANTFATGVTITTAPATMAIGQSQPLVASATTTGTTPPTVFWTSLEPAVLEVAGATATALAESTARVVASVGAFSDTVSIRVFPALVVTTTSLPNATRNAPYSQTLAASGGDGSYAWLVTAGSLPSGLTLDVGTGVISGTPTDVETAAFTVQVASGDAQTATRALSIGVADAPAGFTLTETGGGTQVDESGTTDTFTVVLGVQPSMDVAFDVSSDDTGEVTVSPSTLTFTTASWDTPQTVTVTGVDDMVVDGDQMTAVTVSVNDAASDDAFDALADQVVSVTTTDDDVGAPSVVSWASAGNGNWNAAVNWSPARVPQAGDSVVIDVDGTYTVTVDQNATIQSLALGAASGTQTLSLNGFDLDVAGDAAVTVHGVLDVAGTFTTGGTFTNLGEVRLNGGTLDGALANDGTLVTHGPAMLTGAVTTSGSSLMRVEGSASGGEANLTVSSGFTNQGTIELTSLTTDGATLTLTSGTFVNQGTVSALVGGGGGRTLNAALTNEATLEVQATLSATGDFAHAAGAVLEGSGTLDLSSANVTSFSGNMNPGHSPGILSIAPPAGGLTQQASGTLNIELNGTTVGTGYDQVNVTGDVDFGGDLVVLDTTAFTPAPGDTFAIATFASVSGKFQNVTLPVVAGVTLDTLWAEAGTTDTLFVVASVAPGGLPASIHWTNSSGGSWNDAANWTPQRVPAADDTVAIDAAGSYTVTLIGSATVSGLLIGGAGAPTLEMVAQNANSTLTVNGEVLNEGLIDMSQVDVTGQRTVELVVNGGTLRNAPTGVIQGSQGGAWGYRNVTGQVVNEGTVRTNSNSLSLTSLTNTAGSVANVPSWTLAVVSELDHQAAALLEGGGTFYVAGASITGFDGDVEAGGPGGTSALTVDRSGGTWSPAGSMTFELNGTVSGSEFDQVNVSGTVDVGSATLEVALGFSPTAGTQFQIITADAVSGTFGALNLPAGWTSANVVYNAGSVVLIAP